MKKTKIVTIISLILISSWIVKGQFTGSASNIIVRTDANNNLLVALGQTVFPTTATQFPNTTLRTDNLGQLLVTIGDANSSIIQVQELDATQIYIQNGGHLSHDPLGGGIIIWTTTPVIFGTSFSTGTIPTTIEGISSSFMITIGNIPITTTGTVSWGTGTPFSNAPGVICNNDTSGNLIKTTSSTVSVLLTGVWVAGDTIRCIALGY